MSKSSSFKNKESMGEASAMGEVEDSTLRSLVMDYFTNKIRNAPDATLYKILGEIGTIISNRQTELYNLAVAASTEGSKDDKEYINKIENLKLLLIAALSADHISTTTEKKAKQMLVYIEKMTPISLTDQKHKLIIMKSLLDNANAEAAEIDLGRMETIKEFGADLKESVKSLFKSSRKGSKEPEGEKKGGKKGRKYSTKKHHSSRKHKRTHRR